MISIVIPAYNEEEHIAQSLEAFMHQTIKEPFEIIVVDNASTDNTQKIAKTFEKKLPLRVVSEQRKGRGYARGTGFEAAQGEIILSTDADGMVPSNWIEKLVQPFVDPHVVAVTGSIRSNDLSSFKNTLVSVGMPIAIYIYKLLYRHFWLTGSNFGIRKDVYEKSGGFAKVNGFEDIDLGMRVYKLGKIKYQHVYVGSSGRRFTNIFLGVGDYLRAWKDYFIDKDENVHISDARN